MLTNKIFNASALLLRYSFSLSFCKQNKKKNNFRDFIRNLVLLVGLLNSNFWITLAKFLIGD